MGRRDFVRLMAGVGAVALLAGVNALSGTAGDQAEAASATQEGGRRRGPGRRIVGKHGQRMCRALWAAVLVPGTLSRYTDANNNGRCDLGECLS